jgi:FkbM family methyltransferase
VTMGRAGGYGSVLAYVAKRAPTTEFMLVDVGCGGGIDEIWWKFGPRLRALAIDPDGAEIDRLRRAQSRPGIEYLAAFAALRADHPFARHKAGQSDSGRTPWSRLAVARTLQVTSDRAESSRISSGGGETAPSVPRATPPPAIDVPDFLAQRGITSVDFLKIDVDGKDLEVLHSFASSLDSLQILGLLLEVNFHGSTAETDHTLHNTDRLMKGHGFELFDLTTRRYSMAALPAQYLYGFPAEGNYGRVLQGDALYVRDLGSPEHDEFTARLAPGKLLNLVCIFSAFNLPDCAAEIVLRFDRTLAMLCDTEHMLDLLAAQAQGPFRRRPLTYRQYMARFEAQHPMFFPRTSRARRAVVTAVTGSMRLWWRFKTLLERERTRVSPGRQTS